jgi:hypothetical protein
VLQFPGSHQPPSPHPCKQKHRGKATAASIELSTASRQKLDMLAETASPPPS